MSLKHPVTKPVDVLVQRLADRRGKRVVFLSHCILNENTRYKQRAPAALLLIAARYTRRAYRRLARSVAAQIEDYVASGFSVLGIVGIDGSPSCGVRKTLDLRGAMRAISQLEPTTISIEQQNAVVRHHARGGQGIFVEELEKELKRRRLQIPLLAHDLLNELDGLSSEVRL
jgi:hypothetical protein